MTNYIATLYSHKANFDQITNEAKSVFPKAEWQYERKNEFTEASITMKSGFLQGKKRIKIRYRERDTLGFELKDVNCPVTSNLQGMYNLVQSIQTKYEDIKNLLLKKIETINSEFSIIMESNAEKEFKALVDHLASATDAVVFAQPRTGLMNSLNQSWLDQDLNLILDTEGNSNVSELKVEILAKYFDGSETEIPEQADRKTTSEKYIKSLGITVNPKLPPIPTEENTTFRSAKEISERIVALALTNLVAFNNIKGEQALQFANKHEIINLLTPQEIEFLKNPTQEAKTFETWKCEGIWTLCWALGIVDELNFPNKMADLSKIDGEHYPIGSELKPSEFMEKHRTVIEYSSIVDAKDLYYRFYWACLDAKKKGREVEKVHPGVVYERLYALNWLTTHKNQDWDHISTDT
ncbi:DUF4272 domain-containing protein [Portibacter marinus]|uniref:DUF4272 domain-containing protein n=1 Tax=Portibacter marinus TaxID=2898660 RepID=UPI001F3DDB5B|nr:DUF4272 domain-containing protein [Portibacter marinus]